MDKLPITVTLIALAVALALWFVAYSLENEARWVPGTEESREQPDWLRPDQERDTPVRAAADSPGCLETEEQLRAQVEQARYCTSNRDCTLFDYGYPIECLTSVSKTSISSLRIAYRDYEEQCEYRVYYDCPTGDVQRRPVCVNNQCSVDISGTDILEEQTLDHLGIDR